MPNCHHVCGMPSALATCRAYSVSLESSMPTVKAWTGTPISTRMQARMLESTPPDKKTPKRMSGSAMRCERTASRSLDATPSADAGMKFEGALSEGVGGVGEAAGEESCLRQGRGSEWRRGGGVRGDGGRQGATEGWKDEERCEAMGSDGERGRAMGTTAGGRAEGRGCEGGVWV